MKEWLTVQEIADEALPGLPNTVRGVFKLADREGWNCDVFQARKRPGREGGGGMEYNIGLLPSLAQVTYRARSIPVGPLPEAKVRSGAALSGRAALERDARLAILRAYAAFEKGQRLNRQGCECLFVSKYQAGTLQVERWIRDLIPAFSRRTLARWRADAERDAGDLGFDRGAARRGKGVLETANDGDLHRFMLALLAHQPHLSAAQVVDQCRGEFGETIEVVRGGGVIERIAMPPLRTFQAALKALKTEKKVLLTKLTNPDHFRSTMRLSGTGTLRHITEPNTLWQIDASPVDALCTDGRHAVYACIDIATRRLKLTITKTPRAEAVGLLIRKAILAWGAPAEIKTDNGSDFTARATKRLFASLGIEMTLSDPFSPEQKGFVERVIGTFQHDCVTLIPGFVGHSVTDRKAIESRKSFAQRLGEDDAQTFKVNCTAAEMQAHFDSWAELRYEQRAHEGLGRRSPFQVAASAAHTIRRVDERALDLLLAPMAKGDGTRVVTKTGIRVNDVRYLNGSILPGTRVFVRHDPQDLGRVFLFGTEEGDFLGEAVNVELSGLPPEVMVRAQRALQSETLAGQASAIEEYRRHLRTGPSLIDRARAVWLGDQPNVVPMPRPEVEHSTPDIAAALAAVTGGDRPVAAQLSDKAAETHARLLAQSEAATPMPATVTRLHKQETPHQRFRRALDLEGRIAAGEIPEPDDLRWLGSYETGSEYRAMSKMHKQFGDEMSL